MSTYTAVRPLRPVPHRDGPASRGPASRGPAGRGPERPGPDRREPNGRGPDRPGAARPGRGPLRLTRRGRLVLVAFLVLLSLGLSFLVLRESSVASNRSGEARYRTVVVEPGQTLWQIAREADPGADPRDTVARIIKFNALPGAVVHPGQRIAVPER